MTIFIDSKEKSYTALLKLLTQKDNRNEQIVGAWHKSKATHCFKDEERFTDAVKKNRQTLRCPKKISLFTASNYFFSTKACNRLETLYFKNAEGDTGRLRPQHKKGPLAKIDEPPKTHLFPTTKDKLESLERCYKAHKKQVGWRPQDIYETRCKVGNHHFEFAYNEKGEPVHGHRSEGIVEKIDKRSREHHINCALKNILGNWPRVARKRVTASR
jgi:hypothetical protein